MPELPEVETVRRTLLPSIGRVVERVWAAKTELRGEPLLGRPLSRSALGAAIAGVRRWGKYLLIDFASRPRVLVVHLGMTGRLRLHRAEEPRVKHTHLVYTLDRGLELRFSDPRRFGHVSLARAGDEASHPPLAVLGVDALDSQVDGTFLHERARSRQIALKSFLLDQSVLAGIGNIYASEALWLAGIKPTLAANRLSRPRADRLADAVRSVLESALDKGGTSLRDFVAADGASGENSHYLRVYDRDGERCPRPGCTGLVRRTIIQGRATFHCPTCQPR